MSTLKPRILLYSHDTYGLGHLRRSLTVAEGLARDLPAAHQLLLTGSMVAGAFGLPPRLDLIKLPALSKRSSGEYTARALPLSLKTTLRWREQMILEAVQVFRPDVVLVDKAPAGVQGELLPTLRYLKTWLPQTRLVLGMRDIEDSPDKTIREWQAAGIPDLHDQVYDRILLYGQREVFDPVRAYRMSAHAEAKMVECGYLGRANVNRPAVVVRRELGLGDEPLIVVTVGGGGDGFDVIKTYLDMLAEWPGGAPFYSFIATGPLMAQGRRQLLRQAARTNHLQIVEFTPDLPSYLAAADLVVSMAGYNTTCEILSLGRRSLLVPRVRTRLEQYIRAERLAERELVQMLHPDLLSPSRLAAAVQHALSLPLPQVTLNLNGLTQVGRTISAMLNEQ